jgi:hypothetical protein
MYSRKQFLIMALRKATHLAVSLSRCSLPLHIPESPQADGLDTESVFQKAMAMGIDPGTMDISQLTRLVLQDEQTDTQPPR